MKHGKKPRANPFVLLREEFDDWAVLFDPDTCRGFGLNPIGVYVWKLLDGEHSIDEMFRNLRQDAAEVPREARDHIIAFVEELAQYGLASREEEEGYDGRRRPLPCPTGAEMTFSYQVPKLINLSGGRATGGCCSSGTSAAAPQNGCCYGNCVYQADCTNGVCAQGVWCDTGTSPGSICDSGNSASRYFCTDGGSAATKCLTGSGASCANGGAP